MDFISKCSKDVLKMIMTLLGAKDLAAFGATCKLLQNTSATVWPATLKRELGVAKHPVLDAKRTYWEVYKDDKAGCFNLDLLSRLDLRYCIRRGQIKTNCRNYPFLHAACLLNYVKAVSVLIADKVDLNEFDWCGRTALTIACQNSQMTIVQLLVNAGAIVNFSDQRGKTPLYHTVKNGDTDIFKFLLDAGAKVDTNPSPLGLAMAYRCDDIVELLKNIIK